MKLICTLFIQEQCEFHIKLSFHKSTLFSAILVGAQVPLIKTWMVTKQKWFHKIFLRAASARGIGAHTRAHALADVPLVACVQTPSPQGTELLDNSPHGPLRTAVQPTLAVRCLQNRSRRDHSCSIFANLNKINFTELAFFMAYLPISLGLIRYLSGRDCIENQFIIIQT